MVIVLHLNWISSSVCYKSETVPGLITAMSLGHVRCSMHPAASSRARRVPHHTPAGQLLSCVTDLLNEALNLITLTLLSLLPYIAHRSQSARCRCHCCMPVSRPGTTSSTFFAPGCTALGHAQSAATLPHSHTLHGLKMGWKKSFPFFCSLFLLLKPMSRI